MIDNYSNEHVLAQRRSDLLRRIEFLRRVHESEMNEIRVPADGFRAEVASLLRRAAERLETRRVRPLLRIR